tara:strand:- start:149 stop:277 length:129 start_codon:yes stop_codon:yes gene_type:complete
MHCRGVKEGHDHQGEKASFDSNMPAQDHSIFARGLLDLKTEG